MEAIPKLFLAKWALGLVWGHLGRSAPRPKSMKNVVFLKGQLQDLSKSIGILKVRPQKGMENVVFLKAHRAPGDESDAHALVK